MFYFFLFNPLNSASSWLIQKLSLFLKAKMFNYGVEGQELRIFDTIERWDANGENNNFPNLFTLLSSRL